jgi:hypothetical protein
VSQLRQQEEREEQRRQHIDRDHGLVAVVQLVVHEESARVVEEHVETI